MRHADYEAVPLAVCVGIRIQCRRRKALIKAAAALLWAVWKNRDLQQQKKTEMPGICAGHFR